MKHLGLVTLLLVACAPIHDTGSLEVFFCPQENCEQIWIAFVGNASDVKCAFYDFDLENLSQALTNAHVLIFEENAKDASTDWIRVQSSGLMHNKFCVVNEKKVITGSMNPTVNGAYKNNNNIVVIESKVIAKNYLEEFDELQRKTHKQTKNKEVTLLTKQEKVLIENYFCPEDQCEQEVMEELSQAQEEIIFMAFTFTSDPIGDLLAQKHHEGVIVKGIFEKRQRSKYWEYDKLLAAGVNVTLDENPFTMHHKVFVIDKKVVITGSYNPTAAANEKNDENILIIHDKEIAGKYVDEFTDIVSI